jgi:hypothetical protein
MPGASTTSSRGAGSWTWRTSRRLTAESQRGRPPDVSPGTMLQLGNEHEHDHERRCQSSRRRASK